MSTFDPARAAEAVAEPSPLATDTMGRLRAYFEECNHRPSAAHWDAVGDVVNTMAAMAAGTCEPMVYLSALDPGVGKTSAVIEFATALATSPEHRTTGMIVCVGRVEEAARLAKNMVESCPNITLAVLVNDGKEAGRNARDLSTVEPAASAQILITTQQRIELATRDRSFAGIAAFHYRGTPRAVRVWDEAWLPGVTVTASRYDILGVLGQIARHSKGCADALDAFADYLKTTKDGDLIAVPDFEADHSVSFRSFMAHTPADDKKRTLAALAALSGQAARVRDDGKAGAKALSYEDTMPDDLRPFLVLDASGRVRETYRMIEQSRGDLHPLRRAIKNYAPLTVHLWERSGSKSGWADRRGADEMIDAIKETIKERPEEDWLIVAHKAEKDIPNVLSRVKRGLPQAVGARVHMITWGRHMATNEFRDVPNVILAGTLFMTASYYTALTHLAQDRNVEGGFASAQDIKRTEHGEHAHLILQAVCRGRVRKSDGDRCHPMNAYLIASKQSGIPGMITHVFPDCTMRTWRETKTKTPRAVSKALSVLMAERKMGHATMTIPALMAAVEMEDRSNFHTSVLKHSQFTLGLQNAGMTITKGAGRRPGLIVLSGEP